MAEGFWSQQICSTQDCKAFTHLCVFDSRQYPTVLYKQSKKHSLSSKQLLQNLSIKTQNPTIFILIFTNTNKNAKASLFRAPCLNFFPKNPQTFSLSLILSLANRPMLNHLTKTSKTPLWALSLSTHFTLLVHGGLISRVLHSELTRFSSTHCLQSSFSRVCWPPCWGKASLMPKFPERSFEIFRCRH